MNPEQFLELVVSGDEQAVHRSLEDEPSLAQATNDQGIGAVMVAMYHRQHATAAVVADARTDLSLLELTALGRTDDVAAALRAAPDLDARSPDGFTALHYAAFFARPDIVELLLGAGADPGVVANNPMRVQPIHSAAAARSLDAVTALLDAGADVNARQERGFTALHAAAHAGDVPLGRLLLDRGADAALTTDDGKDARALAMEGHHRAFEAVLPG